MLRLGELIWGELMDTPYRCQPLYGNQFRKCKSEINIIIIICTFNFSLYLEAVN